MKDLKETIKILEHIHQNPQATQRELVKKLNISLGKVNFLIKALVGRGLIKLERFNNSKSKKSYLYLLTPEGMSQKAVITKKFLEDKMLEYEKLEKEIEVLREQVQHHEDQHTEEGF